MDFFSRSLNANDIRVDRLIACQRSFVGKVDMLVFRLTKAQLLCSHLGPFSAGAHGHFEEVSIVTICVRLARRLPEHPNTQCN